jgi:hypothetical protein
MPDDNDHPIAASDVDFRFRTGGNWGASFGYAVLEPLVDNRGVGW